MEILVDKRQRKRPLDNPETQELIKARVNEEIQTSGEITLEKVYREQVTGRVINEFEHTDLYGLGWATADRIDPFMTEVEDIQETKRLWDKYSKKYNKQIKTIKILLLLLLGAVLDGKDRVIDYISGFMKG